MSTFEEKSITLLGVSSVLVLLALWSLSVFLQEIWYSESCSSSYPIFLVIGFLLPMVSVGILGARALISETTRSWGAVVLMIAIYCAMVYVFLEVTSKCFHSPGF